MFCVNLITKRLFAAVIECTSSSSKNPIDIDVHLLIPFKGCDQKLHEVSHNLWQFAVVHEFFIRDLNGVKMVNVEKWKEGEQGTRDCFQINVAV